jgi:hypothetical protein
LENEPSWPPGKVVVVSCVFAKRKVARNVKQPLTRSEDDLQLEVALKRAQL